MSAAKGRSPTVRRVEGWMMAAVVAFHIGLFWWGDNAIVYRSTGGYYGSLTEGFLLGQTHFK